MKGARNVLVLKWNQFLPPWPLKGTQTPRDPQIIFRELQPWDIEILKWYAYNDMLGIQEENMRTLTFIFKIRQIKLYEYFMNLCWYTYSLGCLEPPCYPEGRVEFHISVGNLSLLPFPTGKFVYGVLYLLIIRCVCLPRIYVCMYVCIS